MEIPGGKVRLLSGNRFTGRRLYDQVDKRRGQHESEEAQKTEEERDDSVHGGPPFRDLFGGFRENLETMTGIMVRRRSGRDNVEFEPAGFCVRELWTFGAGHATIVWPEFLAAMGFAFPCS